MRKRIEINNNIITLDKGYDEFIINCKVRNLRETTIKSYDERMRTVYKFIPPKTPIGSITHDTVDKFILACKDTLKIKDITINSYLRSLKTILYYFMKMGYMDKFKIEMIKYDEPIIETYSIQEIKILLKKPEKSKCTFAEFRNWTICNLLYATGIRCSNILNLKINEVDLFNNLIFLKTTKTRKPLILPISKSLKPILKEYMLIRKGDDKDYLFCNVYGEQLTRNSINNAMRKYNYSRGINKTGIHRWRHTFAKQWIINHGDILKLQKILNHKNLDMVRNYVKIFNDDLQNDFDKYNPLETIQQSSKKSKFKK